MNRIDQMFTSDKDRINHEKQLMEALSKIAEENGLLRGIVIKKLESYSDYFKDRYLKLEKENQKLKENIKYILHREAHLMEKYKSISIGEKDNG